MNFQKISQKIVIGLALLWVILQLMFTMPLRVSYMYFGGLILYLGVQNMIILNLGLKNGQVPEKMKLYYQRYGTQKGTIYYGIFSVLIYILLGLGIIYAGYITP